MISNSIPLWSENIFWNLCMSFRISDLIIFSQKVLFYFYVSFSFCFYISLLMICILCFKLSDTYLFVSFKLFLKYSIWVTTSLFVCFFFLIMSYIFWFIACIMFLVNFMPIIVDYTLEGTGITLLSFKKHCILFWDAVKIVEASISNVILDFVFC